MAYQRELLYGEGVQEKVLGAMLGSILGIGGGFVLAGIPGAVIGGVIFAGAGAACGESQKRYTIDSLIGYERQRENLKANLTQSIAKFKNSVTEKFSNYINLLSDYFRNDIKEDKADKNNSPKIQKSLEKIVNKDSKGEDAEKSSENYLTNETLEYVGVTENSSGESAETQNSQDSSSGTEGNPNNSE